MSGVGVRFKKKPVVIDARRLNMFDYDEACEIVSWCGGEAVEEGIAIQTLEGTMIAVDGDWIIKGVEGEFYPCKPSIFEATYERTYDD